MMKWGSRKKTAPILAPTPLLTDHMIEYIVLVDHNITLDGIQ